MSYKFTSPGRTDAPGTPWQTLTLSLPGDTPLAVPAGRWERRDGHIVATYDRAELRDAVGLALEQRRHGLEVRLARGLEVLAAATGCEDERAERLLAHWDVLSAEYDRVTAVLEEITHQDAPGASLRGERPELGSKRARSAPETCPGHTGGDLQPALIQEVTT